MSEKVGVTVELYRAESGDLWRWRTRPVGDLEAEHSPDGFGSAGAAITAAQGRFGPGGVTIIV